MAEALGAIRIDIFANITEFTRNVQKALGNVQDFGKQANTVVKQMDQTFQQLGAKLSLKVTAPLVGLAVAAVKAADPAKKMGQEMERAGLRAQKALEPLGRVLIEQFGRLKPTIDAAIDTVNGLAVQFSKLSPETQQNIVMFAGLAAAVGPAMLAMSALTTVVKTAAVALGAVWTVGSQLIVTLPLIATLATGVASAFAAWNFGEWIYEAVKPVQKGLAAISTAAMMMWTGIKTTFLVAMEAIKAAWDATVSGITSTASNVLGPMLDAISPGAGTGMRAIVSAGQAGGGKSFSKIREEIQAQTKFELDEFERALGRTYKEIDKNFANASFGGQIRADIPGPLESTLAGADRMVDRLKGLVGGWGNFLDAAREAGAGASQAMVMTAAETEEAKKQAQQLADQLKRDMEKAKEYRFQIYPREKLAEDIANLNILAAKFPTILTEDVVRGVTDKWAKEINKLEQKIDNSFGGRLAEAIKDFSQNVSDAFADLVVDGEMAFDQLAKSFAKMLASMVAKQFIFEPLLGAIGGAVGHAIGAQGSTSGRSTAPVVHGEAGGGVAFSTIDMKSLARPGAGVVVNVYDQSGAGVDVKSRTGPGGGSIVDIIVPGLKAAFAGGRMDRTMKDRYGIDVAARF